MKLEDHIKWAIHKYPTLYKCSNYEDSRKLVIWDLFLSGPGNGYDLVPEGYLHDPWDDQANRVKAKPYGEAKYEGPEMDQEYFDTPIYADNTTETLVKKLGESVRELAEIDPELVKKLGDVITSSERCHKGLLHVHQISTSPHFETLLNSPIKVQPDWMKGAEEAVVTALEHFQELSPTYMESLIQFSIRIRESSEHLRELRGYREGETILEYESRKHKEYVDQAAKQMSDFLRSRGVPYEMPPIRAYGDIYSEIRAKLDDLGESSKEIVSYIVYATS